MILYNLIPNMIKLIKNKVLNTFININPFIISFLNKQFLLRLNSVLLLILNRLINLSETCEFSERSMERAICQVSGSQKFLRIGG